MDSPRASESNKRRSPGYEVADLSNSQHLFAPVHDAIISESVESTVSNTHVETFPADAAIRHPEQDLTSLVNTLLDGSRDLSSSQYLFAQYDVHDDAIISKSVESTVSNTHVQALPATARSPEDENLTAVSTDNISPF